MIGMAGSWPLCAQDGQSDQAHYSGYTDTHFINLLNCLQNIKGKFLLSSYPEKSLMQYREECSVNKLGEERGWRSKDMKQIVSVTGKREETKHKIECLTWNYPIPSGQISLIGDLDAAEYENEEIEEEF